MNAGKRMVVLPEETMELVEKITQRMGHMAPAVLFLLSEELGIEPEAMLAAFHRIDTERLEEGLAQLEAFGISLNLEPIFQVLLGNGGEE